MRTIKRRDFCKLLTGTAACATLPLDLCAAAADAAPAGFGKVIRSYEAFCAMPEAERVFYTLSGDAIVPEKLRGDWKPAG